MSPILILAILCAISFGTMAPGSFFHREKLSFILGAIWLAASLPLMLVCALPERFVLLFYLISGGVGLALQLRGGAA